MKRYAKVVVMAVVLAVGAYAGGFFTTPEDAAMNCPEIQQCIQDGYEMDSCVSQPIYYFVPPTGTYDWGQVNVTMKATNKPIVWATCYVQASEKRGKMLFKETHNTVVIPIR